jgi:hypothetical protein
VPRLVARHLRARLVDDILAIRPNDDPIVTHFQMKRRPLRIVDGRFLTDHLWSVNLVVTPQRRASPSRTVVL